MQSKFLCLLLILMVGLCNIKGKANAIGDSLNLKNIKIAISGNYGTSGAGIGIHYQLNNLIGMKLGYFKGKFNANYFTNFEGNKIEVKGNFHLEMLQLLIDIYPWRTKNFRITTGLARNYNKYKVTLSPQSSQTFGYIVYTPDLIGNMSASVNGLAIAPYLGFGFDKTVPKHKIGIGLDIGSFYHGQPKFNLKATGSFEPSGNAENAKILEQAFSQWRFFPFINFQLKYRI